MKKIFNTILGFFVDGEGSPSAMRLVMIVWMLGTFVICAILSIKNKTLVTPDLKTYAFLTSLAGGKLVQNYTESLNSTTTATTTLNTTPAAPTSTTQ